MKDQRKTLRRRKKKKSKFRKRRKIVEKERKQTYNRKSYKNENIIIE